MRGAGDCKQSGAGGTQWLYMPESTMSSTAPS